MRNLVLIICLLSLIGSLFCQEEFKVEVKQDSVSIKKPFKAALLSFFVPGGGQFYNEKYLKSAFVFALEGSLIGLAIYHNYQSNDNYNKYNSTENPEYYSKYVQFYEKQQSDLWWLGTVIFLSTIDAFVDAHLFDYDVRKNRIHLKFEDNMVGFQYNF